MPSVLDKVKQGQDEFNAERKKKHDEWVRELSRSRNVARHVVINRGNTVRSNGCKLNAFMVSHMNESR